MSSHHWRVISGFQVHLFPFRILAAIKLSLEGTCVGIIGCLGVMLLKEAKKRGFLRGNVHFFGFDSQFGITEKLLIQGGSFQVCFFVEGLSSREEIRWQLVSVYFDRVCFGPKILFGGGFFQFLGGNVGVVFKEGYVSL